MLKRGFTGLLASLLLTLGLAATHIAPAAAYSPWDYGYWEWNRSGCNANLYWRYLDITDTSSGYTWAGAEYWADWGGSNGQQVTKSYGPIRDKYRDWGWECGSLGVPTSDVYQTTQFYNRYGPVFRQNFQRGYILDYTNNLCRCYNNPGNVYVYLY